MSEETRLRREICEVGRLVFDRGLVSATDGNISARLGDGRILITPSGSCLGRLRAEALVVMDAAGRPANASEKPSSERWMHLAAYAERSDVKAAIHAHPPAVIAMTLSQTPLSARSLPEWILAFGQVPLANYATPATEEGAEAVRGLVRQFDAIVLDRHGSFTVGASLWEAFDRLDRLEHGARILQLAWQLGRCVDLPPAEVEKLAKLRERLGMGRAADVPADWRIA